MAKLRFIAAVVGVGDDPACSDEAPAQFLPVLIGVDGRTNAADGDRTIHRRPILHSAQMHREWSQGAESGDTGDTVWGICDLYHFDRPATGLGDEQIDMGLKEAAGPELQDMAVHERSICDVRHSLPGRARCGNPKEPP